MGKVTAGKEALYRSLGIDPGKVEAAQNIPREKGKPVFKKQEKRPFYNEEMEFLARDALEGLHRKAMEEYDEFADPHDAFGRLMDVATPAEQQFLNRLMSDDLLGFDYPHQAIELMLESPENIDASPALKGSITKMAKNYAPVLMLAAGMTPQEAKAGKFSQLAKLLDEATGYQELEALGFINADKIDEHSANPAALDKYIKGRKNAFLKEVEAGGPEYLERVMTVLDDTAKFTDTLPEREIITPSQIYEAGDPMLGLQGDVSATGRDITEFGGVKIPGVTAEGGPRYMQDKPYIWASELQTMKGYHERAKLAAEIEGRPMRLIHTAMGEDAMQHPMFVMDAWLQANILSGRLPKESIQALEQMVRDVNTGTKANPEYGFKDFQGFDDPGLYKKLEADPDLRKAILGRSNMKPAREMGFTIDQDILNAFVEQGAKPWKLGDVGFTQGLHDPTKPVVTHLPPGEGKKFEGVEFVEDPVHGTYTGAAPKDLDDPLSGAGFDVPIPYEVMFHDVMQQPEILSQSQLPKYRSNRVNTAAQSGGAASEEAREKLPRFIQRPTNEWLDRVENVRSAIKRSGGDKAAVAAAVAAATGTTQAGEPVRYEGDPVLQNLERERLTGAALDYANKRAQRGGRDAEQMRQLLQQRQQMQQQEVQPAQVGFFRDLVTGENRMTPEVEEAPYFMSDYPGMREFSAPALKASASTLFSWDDEEKVNQLRKYFPDVDYWQDEKGNWLAKHKQGGDVYAINKPGIGLDDLSTLVAEGLALYSPYKWAAKGKNLKSQLGRASVAGAGVQSLIEALQSQTGGEFDPEDVAAMAVLEPLFGFAVPAGGGRMMEPVKDYLADALQKYNIEKLAGETEATQAMYEDLAGWLVP